MFDKNIHNYSKLSDQIERDRKSRELIAEKQIRVKDRVDISLEEYEKMKSEISRLEYEKQELLKYLGYFKQFIRYDIVPDSIISFVDGNMINPYKRCRIEFDFIPKRGE